MLKRNTFVLIALLFSSIFITACGGVEDVTPVRGSWDNNVYTSEWLDLRFIMSPPLWSYSTDEEIAELFGFVSELLPDFGASISEDFWELSLDSTFREMMAINWVTGGNVQIAYERLSPVEARLSIDRILSDLVEAFEEEGVRASLNTGTTQIGGYNWHSIDTEIDIFGMTMYGRQFLNVRGNSARMITISSQSPDEIYDILDMFYTANAPIPSISVEIDQTLVGSWGSPWALDLSDDFVFVFNENGTGTRGFYNQHESFTWQIINSDLIIYNLPDVDFPIESWSYTIVDNELTLDSNQVPGLTLIQNRLN